MLQKFIHRGILLMTLLGLSTISNGAVIYSDRALFENELVTQLTDDFENSAYTTNLTDAGMSAVFGETSYQSTGFNNLNMVTQSGDQYYCSGCNGSFLLDFTGSRLVTGNGVYGVGFDFLTERPIFGNSSEFFHAWVTFGDGSTQDYALPETSGFDFQFFGITSLLKIESIHFGLANGGATTDQSLYFGLDDLTLGSDIFISLPEPSTWTLFAGGLLFVAYRKSKRLR
ncbi:hypothetical protein OLMES_5485 [Oleiphilus messinensis]|uniref:PEP-CTERM protein-sorting domain-containing protein n=1 Tax=Oleiphilus messinensis TaxID=141451 RepID=A0A1Y0IIW8_9GAMM|nr:hypothetical protein [Oleiphilus messinensis]ARU59465.1 hypothetical protein OLMES_5485 [Oleiphilus messinensis]